MRRIVIDYGQVTSSTVTDARGTHVQSDEIGQMHFIVTLEWDRDLSAPLYMGPSYDSAIRAADSTSRDLDGALPIVDLVAGAGR